MNRQGLVIALSLLIEGFYLPGADCQQPKPFPVQPAPLHVVWHDVFGVSRNTPNIMYCLMGNGFFRAPTSGDLKHLISIWLLKHPNARVIPVEASGPTMVNQPHSEQVYAWVVDGKDNMNEYLVRQGGCPGGTMLVPDRSHYPKEATGTSFSKMLISQQEYVLVINRMAKAEAEAQKERLRIWKHGTDIF